MTNISAIICSLMLVEMIVLSLCMLSTMMFLNSTLIKRLRIRQEVRAEEYLIMINRAATFQIRGFTDFAAISYIFMTLIPIVLFVLDPPNERHCSEIFIGDWQQYIQYTLTGLSSLAILDCLISSSVFGRITKTDILATLLGYYKPLTFFALLYSLSFFAPKYETVVTVCYREDHAMTISNDMVAKCLFVWRFLHFLLIFMSCVMVHVTHSHSMRMAAEMAVSIFKDLKRGGVDKDNTLIHIELDRESATTTDLFCDAENMRMWRKYFLSWKAEMSVPSVCESLCRFTYERARLCLYLVIYVAFIIGVYYYTENFFHDTKLGDFTFLIFATLLTFNNIARVPVVEAFDSLKEEATYRKIYNKDSVKAIVEFFIRIYQYLRR